MLSKVGGQLIRNYIIWLQYKYKTLTRYFGLSGYPASSFFARCCLGKIQGGAPFSQLHKGHKQSRTERISGQAATALIRPDVRDLLLSEEEPELPDVSPRKKTPRDVRDQDGRGHEPRLLGQQWRHLCGW